MGSLKSGVCLLLFLTVPLAACAAPTSSPTPLSVPHLTRTAIPVTATSTIIPPTLTSLIPSATPTESPVLRFTAGNLVHDLAWSPDGGQLAVAAGTEIHLYDGVSLVDQYVLPVGVWAERIAFHPSLPILGAAAKDGNIRFWNTTNGQGICRFRAHRKGANSLAFQAGEQPGNLLITTGAEITSRVWDISAVTKGECEVPLRAELIGSSYTAPDVAFSADGQRFVLVDVRNLVLRESRTRKLIALLKGDRPIFDLALSPDGRWLAAAQSEATLTLWDLATTLTPSATTLHLPATNPQAYTWRVDFSSDSSLLAGGTSDGQLIVWTLPALQPVFHRTLSDAVSALAFKPNARLLAVGVLEGQVYFYPVDQ